jgi:23S rRNA pseudouridine1911/1915/1917 synthase
MPEQGELTIQVGTQDAGMRVDTFLSTQVADLSRSYAAALIQKQQILVNAKPLKPSYKLKAGDCIHVRLPKPTQTRIIPEPIDLDVVFEDPYLIVVNKPAGLVVHPAAGHSSGTLVNALLNHCPDIEGIGGEQRPGIVHRLDKDTSGLLIVAKDNPTHNQLAQQFKNRKISKQYLAIIRGAPVEDSGCIELPVGRHPLDRKKMSTISSKGRNATTIWHVKQRYQGATLIEADLITGRTHQLRVHFQAIGYPILGDPVYSGRRGIYRDIKAGHPLRPLLKWVNRQMLHACRMSLRHPHSGQQMTFSAPLPDDMSNVLNLLVRFQA